MVLVNPRIAVLGFLCFKRSFKVSSIMYINHVVEGKRTLGSISCNPTTYRPLRPNPFQLSAFGVAPGLRLFIRRYSSSLEFFLSRVLVPYLGHRNTARSSLVETTRTSQAGCSKALQADQTLPCSTPGIPEDSSQVKP